MSKSVSASNSGGGRTGVVHAGSKNSVIRLQQMQFDPIGELVNTYRKIEKEIERQEAIQQGFIVELNQHGKPRAYRAEVHHALFDKLTNIGDKLLRYRYGRVPENMPDKAKGVKSLIIELTGEGETYVVNGGDEGPEDDDMPDMPMRDVSDE